MQKKRHSPFAKRLQALMDKKVGKARNQQELFAAKLRIGPSELSQYLNDKQKT